MLPLKKVLDTHQRGIEGRISYSVFSPTKVEIYGSLWISFPKYFGESLSIGFDVLANPSDCDQFTGGHVTLNRVHQCSAHSNKTVKTEFQTAKKCLFKMFRCSTYQKN